MRRKLRGKSADEWNNRLSLVDATNMSFDVTGLNSNTRSSGVGGSGNSSASKMHACRSFEANLDFAGDDDIVIGRQVTHHTPGASFTQNKTM